MCHCPEGHLPISLTSQTLFDFCRVSLCSSNYKKPFKEKFNILKGFNTLYVYTCYYVLDIYIFLIVLRGEREKPMGSICCPFVFFKTTRSYVVRRDDESLKSWPPHTTQTCKLSKEISHRTIYRFGKAIILSIMQENIKKRLHNEPPVVLAWKRTTCQPMKVTKCILMANEILWEYWCKSQVPRVCDIQTLQQL